MTVTSLTPMQEALWELFADRRNSDVAIWAMYQAVYAPNDAHVVRYVSAREMQQKLGPILQRLNRKLYGQHIVPGQMKRTYRLVAKQPV